ncbi:hypothetical protein BKA69DRAFT_1128670 [Paraphysoderma sedebokerense]|nr:hypothetical protein BKA69DRAFT_1128670 [Paraphysoderma sedebokerense]
MITTIRSVKHFYRAYNVPFKKELSSVRLFHGTPASVNVEKTSGGYVQIYSTHRKFQRYGGYRVLSFNTLRSVNTSAKRTKEDENDKQTVSDSLLEHQSIPTSKIQKTGTIDISDNSKSSLSSSSSSTFSDSGEQLTQRQKLQNILSRVLALPELKETWLKRLAGKADNENWDGPLKILVVGEPNTGKAALVNVLLGPPKGQELLPHDWTVMKESGKVYKIGHGDNWKKIEETGDFIRMTCPSEILKSGIEFYVAPGLQCFDSNKSYLTDLVHKSDITLFVTDTLRQLSSPREVEFLSQHVNRQTAVVLNGLDYLEDETVELPVAVQSVQSRLSDRANNWKTNNRAKSSAVSTDFNTPLPPVFPVSTRRARVARHFLNIAASIPSTASSSNETVSSLDPAADFKTSGIPSLQSFVSSLTPAAARIQHKYNSTLSTTHSAISSILASHAEAHNLLQNLDRQLQFIISQVSDEREQMEKTFQSELAVVDYSLGEVRQRVREFFDGITIWKLMIRGDEIADELRTKVIEDASKGGVLQEAEHKMTYTVGYFNASLDGTYSALRRRLNALATHPTFHDNPSTTSLCQVISNLVDLLDKESKPARVDPFLLSNIVYNYRMKFEGGDKWTSVKRQVERAVIKGAGVGIVSALTGWGLFVGGLPLVMAAGLGVGGISIGLLYTKSLWARFENEFIRSNNALQESLKSELTETFKNTASSRLTDPLATVVQLYDDALSGQTEVVQKRELELRDLKEEMEEILTGSRFKAVKKALGILAIELFDN